MVPKGNLLKYSKSFYEKLMLYCGHCEVVCAEAYLIERALHAIWTEDFCREKVIMYQLINNFIQSAKEIDDDIFPFMANKDWEEGKPVYYSGPYWDDLEAQELIYAVLKGSGFFWREGE